MKIVSGILIGLMAVAAAGCAGKMESAATVAPTVDVTGNWAGTWTSVQPGLGQGLIEMTLKQSGSKYEGTLTVTGSPTNPSGPTEGIVSGNEVRLVRPSGLTGSLTVDGDRMQGTLQGMIAGRVTLTRRK